MARIKTMLNLLVILIIVFMTALTAVFIYSSVLFKNKITIQTVRKTELVSELITRSVSDLMSAGHAGGRYLMVLSYGNVLGVDDIGIFRTNGSEAFEKEIMEAPQDVTLGRAPRSIEKYEEETFKKAAATANSAGFFNWEEKTYSQYVPLKSEGACAVCHDTGTKPLGVLKIRLEAESDLSLLNNLRNLIWTLGVIVFLPLTALLVAGAVIRDKNRLYDQLQDSNISLRHTFDKLNETRGYLQMILDNSKVIMVTTDEEGRIVEFNREGEELLEYRKDEVIGKDVLMLYANPEERPEHMRRGRPIGDEVWAVRNRNVVFRSKSGRPIHVSLTLSTMVNDKGKIIGTVGVGKDVSEQRMLQFKLLQSEKLAGIGTLASGIAHEINNPLAGILGMAEAIRDEDDMGLIRSYTKDIIQYAVNASSIVKELSSYSRSVNSEERSTVDLSSVIENSLKMARHSASFASIEIATDLPRGCHMTANSSEIQQVFVNLIINSIHAMEDKGTLTLRCRAEGGFVFATVEDTGHGIPREHLSQIFDPFFTTKPVGKGTGLGLYVAYRIVTKHKGSIDVDTEVGRGTIFTLRFPSSEASGES